MEQASVGHYTLRKASGGGEWMTQWLLEQKLIALNTMYKELPRKQATYRTPKGVEKQLDYILVDKKHCCWSRDAEANDMIHMRSDHRCVMATFVIPAKAKQKPLHSETTRKRTHGRTRCLETKAEHEFEVGYQDLEKEIKEAEPAETKQAK